MSGQSQVAVIVVSYNTRELSIEAVASVFDSTQGFSIEVIVVDNGSTDGSAEAIIGAYPKVRTIANRDNLGFAAACNQGIRATSSPMILLLNSDARLTREGLAAMVSCLELNPLCGAAGCSIVDFNGLPRTSTWFFLNPYNQAVQYITPDIGISCRYFRRAYKPELDELGCDSSVDWIDAACLMLRRKALADIGLFDERFFMYSEDEDMCFRLRQKGWTICYTAAGSAAHMGGASSSRQSSKMLGQFYLSQMLLLSKHHGLSVTRQYVSVTRVALILKRVLSPRRRCQARERLRALVEAKASLDL